MTSQIESAKADVTYWTRKYDKDPSYYVKSMMTASKKRYDQLLDEYFRRRNQA